ncbi:hypothetical protein ACP4OV_003516 [Aristida adscensionis]
MSPLILQRAASRLFLLRFAPRRRRYSDIGRRLLLPYCPLSRASSARSSPLPPDLPNTVHAVAPTSRHRRLPHRIRRDAPHWARPRGLPPPSPAVIPSRHACQRRQRRSLLRRPPPGHRPPRASATHRTSGNNAATA